MKKHLKFGIALAAIAGLTLAVQAQTNIDQAQYPYILQQPVDQCVAEGATVTFSVVATNVTSYQWLFNGVAMDGQTNSTLIVSDSEPANVGFYSASLINGSEVVPTRSALLNVYTTTGSVSTGSGSFGNMASSSFSSGGMQPDDDGGGEIVVFGSPVGGNGGSGSGCPGKYSGYVNYILTPSQGWGWAPATNTEVYTATDTNSSNTKVEYVGDYGDNGCAQTTVTVPYPAMSPVYRFTIYFPRGVTVPTNAYPIELNGFVLP